MIVKSDSSPTSVYDKCKTIYQFQFRFRWLLIMTLVAIIIIGTILASIYFGMYLNKTGQSITLKRWVLSLVNHKLSFIPNYFSGLFATPERIYIDIKHKNYMKLAHKRQEASERGYLLSSADDWVPAKIRHDGKTYRIAMRLKGDTNDHWVRNDRWSFKIKVKDNKTLFGMKRFAIQDPRTRLHMVQWYCHKMLAYYGLIHLRYDFIQVTINGKDQPIYAIEENFDKYLIENNSHREGPIIRFASGYDWGNKKGMLPYLMGASIDPYQKGKILSSDVLLAQFKAAKNKIELFRQSKLKASKVFDVKKLARFFALNDLFGHLHAISIDNLKFYYNPITRLVEPIGYDMEGFYQLEETGDDLWGLGKQIGLDPAPNDLNTEFEHDVFKDIEFFKAYIKSLEEISANSFLDAFFLKTDAEYKEKLQILHKSYPWYNFNGKAALYENQKYIRDYLSPKKCLQVYFKDYFTRDNIITLKIRNIYALPIEILGLSYAETMIYKPMLKAIFQAKTEDMPIVSSPVKFMGPRDYRLPGSIPKDLKVNYRLLGGSKIFQETVIPWSDIDDHFQEKELIVQSSPLNDLEYLTVDEKTKTISFKSGDLVVENNLIIPNGYLVIGDEGLNINLLNKSKIISYSPLAFIGSEKHPIKIYSSDATGQGVVVLMAGRESTLKHVHFENLSNPSQHDWELTAAVTFYESPVIFFHCRFIGSRAEDALNIVRSGFKIKNAYFSNNMSDAFDGDFTKGQIENSTFINSGNDAIDVSGSVIDLQNINIKQAGDKAISAGENSRMTARQIVIKNAEIGLTSKDFSDIAVENIGIYQSRVGFSVYQKKPEFGPATIRVMDLRTDDVEVDYLIETGSKLTIDDKTLAPTGDKIKNILYGVEYGKSSR